MWSIRGTRICGRRKKTHTQQHNWFEPIDGIYMNKCKNKSCTLLRLNHSWSHIRTTARQFWTNFCVRVANTPREREREMETIRWKWSVGREGENDRENWMKITEHSKKNDKNRKLPCRGNAKPIKSVCFWIYLSLNERFVEMRSSNPMKQHISHQIIREN